MNVGIIGLGRFGQLLKEILEPHFDVKACDTEITDDVLNQQTLFIAVPISMFEATIKKIAPQLKKNTTVIDVCSVKVFPVQVMQDNLPDFVDIIATHPLFGPDSFKTNHHKKIMLANIRDHYQHFEFWKTFFANQEVEAIEMSPEQHDQYMAKSQGITHLIGRALAEINAQSTPLNTAGYDQLQKIMHNTCNDSWELFYDLQRYNPYSKAENQKLVDALTKLCDAI